MRYIFVLHNFTTPSQVMRGVNIAKELNRCGIEAHCVTQGDLKSIKIDKKTICIMVKVFDKSVVNYVRKHKGIIVYDQVDKFDDWDILKTEFDYIIACNESHIDKIKSINSKSKVVLIPHLHVVTKPRKFITGINTVGYVGQIIQFCMEDEIKKYCTRNRLKWYVSEGNIPKTYESETLNVDLGVIYVDDTVHKNSTKHVLNYKNIVKYKPATKITNYFSYGIPCLFVPYNSFLEVIKPKPNLNYLVVNNKDEVLKKIDELRSNQQLLTSLCDDCYELGQQYNISMAKNYYTLFK